MSQPLPPLGATFARALPGLYAAWSPREVPSPALVQTNTALAHEVGLDVDALTGADGIRILAGAARWPDSTPIAQAYAGHQFGGFSPSLGDGRAVLLGELDTPDGRTLDLALKGSGRTVFSRGGDGKCALGPALRELVIGEAMHHLGIPTSRTLTVVTTGEQVWRDAGPAPGAVLSRVASSHVRIGSFEYLAARGRHDELRDLVEYALARHPADEQSNGNPALTLLSAVAERTAALTAKWMLVGFIHGVMNTDNVAISGETLDFGPCAFLEEHHPDAVFSSIDHSGRYAYGNQPQIAHWNLAALAQCLIPLLDDSAESAIDRARAVLDTFPERYERHWVAGMRRKLGLTTPRDDDAELARAWLDLMTAHRLDHTLAFRALGDPRRLADLTERHPTLTGWVSAWHERTDPAVDLGRINPIAIPRNHLVEEALAAAVRGDYTAYERLLEAIRQPYDERPDRADLYTPAPEGFTRTFRTFCGT